MLSILLLSAVAGTSAIFGGSTPRCCRSNPSLREVASAHRDSNVQYVLGTIGAVTELDNYYSFLVSNPKSLNLPPSGSSTPDFDNTIEVFAPKSGCGDFSSAPVTQGQKSILQLTTDVPSDVEDENGVDVEEVTDADETPEAPEVPELPRPHGPCKLKVGHVEDGSCITTSACRGFSQYGFTSKPWSGGNGDVDDGCRPFAANIQCCIRGSTSSAAPRTSIRPRPRPERGVQHVRFFLRQCEGSVLPTCLNGAGSNCLDEATSTALITNKDTLELTDSDLTGEFSVSEVACEHECRNDSVCFEGVCRCHYPYGGDSCDEELPFCEPGQTAIIAAGQPGGAGAAGAPVEAGDNAETGVGDPCLNGSGICQHTPSSTCPETRQSRKCPGSSQVMCCPARSWPASAGPGPIPPTYQCKPALTFDNIIPGAGNGDTWMIGDRRDIQFTVTGYTSMASTKKARVVIMNEDAGANCATGWNSGVYHFDVRTVDLAQEAASASDSSQFVVSVPHALAGDACMTEGSNYRIIIEALDENDYVSADGPTTQGGKFSVGFVSCMSNTQEIGVCVSTPTCQALSDSRETSSCGIGGGTTCCVPDHTPATSVNAWAAITSPNEDGDAIVYMNGNFNVQWARGSRSPNSRCSDLTDGENLAGTATLLLRATNGWYSDSTSINYGEVDFSTGSKTVQIAPQGDEDVPLEADEWYYFQLQSGRCKIESRQIQLKRAGCESAGAETVIGHCQTSDTECPYDETPRPDLCQSFGPNVACCAAPRSGMSQGFRDGAGTLGIDGTRSVLSLVLAAAVLAFQMLL